MLVAVYSADERYRATMVELVAGQGHRVLQERDSRNVLPLARAQRPQLLVLCNADGSAVALLQQLRADPALRRLPVLCVDPRAGAAETVAMLDAGADDAISKPFQPPIFLARVRTLLRRAVWAGEAPADEAVTVLHAGSIELRLLSRQCLAGGRPVELTRLEFELLAQLLRYPDRAFKREELLAAVWNYPGNVETRTLDKHVESLRRKLGAAGQVLQTVHGVGYRFSPLPAPR
jgi:two-component system alkaline phosphatase synthesis response regulator PhoP